MPSGLKMEVKGMSNLLTETFSSLQTGLLAALIVILLLLAANYQSFKLSLIVLSTYPLFIGIPFAIIAYRVNAKSSIVYEGIIMATGVSVANSILIVTNSEKLRI